MISSDFIHPINISEKKYFGQFLGVLSKKILGLDFSKILWGGGLGILIEKHGHFFSILIGGLNTGASLQMRF